MKRYEESEFAIVGVNSDESREKLLRVMAENELTWRSFFDGGGTDGPIATRWRVTGWPTVYLLDAHGVIRAIYPRDLDAEIAKLVEELRAGR